MLKRYSLAILFAVAMAHNAYAVIDPILLMGNVAQYIEQFKEGVNTLEDMYRRMEELGILQMVDDVEKTGANLQGAMDDVMGAAHSLQSIKPGKVGGSFSTMKESLPLLPTQPYKPSGKNTVAEAAKKGFAGKGDIKKWVKKEVFSSARKKDSDKPTDLEVLEEKRLLVDNMRNATAVDAYAYGVMVEERLDSMSAEEESKSLFMVSDATTQSGKLKAMEALQGRIGDRLNEINKLQAKLTELSAVNSMTPDNQPDESSDDKKDDKDKEG